MYATSAASRVILLVSVRAVAMVTRRTTHAPPTDIATIEMAAVVVVVVRDVRVVVEPRDAFAVTRAGILRVIVARPKRDATDAIKRVTMPKSVRTMWRAVRATIVASRVTFREIVPSRASTETRKRTCATSGFLIK